MDNRHHDACFAFCVSDPHAEALNHIIPNINDCAVKPLPYKYCNSYTSCALSILPEEPEDLHPICLPHLVRRFSGLI